jgi:Family of unknown function (DUF5723)
MKNLTYIFLSLSFCVNAQINFSGSSTSFGRATSVATNIDYFALNTNPSNLGWQSKFYPHRFSINIFERSLMTYSSLNIPFAVELVDRNITGVDESFSIPISSIAEVFWSYSENIPFDTLNTLEDRLKFKEILEGRNAIKYNRTLVGASFRTEKNGTFALQINDEIVGEIQFSQHLANLFTLGKINPYFDSLVLSSGQVVANDPALYTNAFLQDIVHAFSNDTLTIGEQLDGSRVKILNTRNYTLGWGNQYKTIFPNWETYIGANINIIEGKNIVDWETIDNEFYMRNAQHSDVSNSRGQKNSGFGLSTSLSASFLKKDKWILGVSLNNIGFINWRSSKKNAIVDYNSLNENNVFDYAFGTQKNLSFYDQWAEANLYLSSGKNYTEVGSFTTATAANLSLGAQWMANRFISLSSDLILPINSKAIGSYQTPYIAFGADFLFSKIGFSTGINNNFDQLNVPFGLHFGSIKSRLVFTLSTMDLLNYFEGKNMQNVTIATGMQVRFK